jgi:hypothetical protein
MAFLFTIMPSNPLTAFTSLKISSDSKVIAWEIGFRTQINSCTCSEALHNALVIMVRIRRALEHRKNEFPISVISHDSCGVFERESWEDWVTQTAQVRIL